MADRHTCRPWLYRGLTSLIWPGGAGLLVLTLAQLARAGDACDPALLDDIQGTVVLPHNCHYQRSIRMTHGASTLDCNGSVFDGTSGLKNGLIIDSGGEPLADITVRNCIFRNFASSAIRIGWDIPDTGKGSARDAIYTRTPTRILLQHIRAEHNAGVGIYLDDYVTEVTLQHSVILGSGGAGLYLEHSSRGIRVENNTFIGNGAGPGKKARREAIAVDSSAENFIIGNYFRANAAGGIFLYKNCGEHFGTGKQVLRWQHSNNNTIRDNVFDDETIGIWLASRKKRDLSRWDCGDKARAGHAWYDDFADHNNVENNSFCRTATPIIDDGNHNRIMDTRLSCEAVTTP